MNKIKPKNVAAALAIVAIGVFLPVVVMSDVFNGNDGTHVGQDGRPVFTGKAGSKLAFYGATATPKPIITRASPGASDIIAALAAEGLLATATPTPTPSATFTPTPTPTP